MRACAHGNGKKLKVVEGKGGAPPVKVMREHERESEDVNAPEAISAESRDL